MEKFCSECGRKIINHHCVVHLDNFEPIDKDTAEDVISRKFKEIFPEIRRSVIRNAVRQGRDKDFDNDSMLFVKHYLTLINEVKPQDLTWE